MGADARHQAGVGPVQADGHPQDAGHGSHRGLVLGAQGGELGVLGRRGALAVVAGDERHHLDLVVGEAREMVGVPDDVVAVLVVLGVRHVQPDVGQQRGRLEQLPGVVAQAVEPGRLVEQLEGQLGHMGTVLGLVVHELGQAGDAAPPQVVEVVEGGTVATLEGVEQRPLSQGVARDHHLVDAEHGHGLLGDDGPGQDDVGPARLHAVDGPPAPPPWTPRPGS